MDPQIPRPFDFDPWQRGNRKIDRKCLETGKYPESEHVDEPEQRITQHGEVPAKGTSLASQRAPSRNSPFAPFYKRGLGGISEVSFQWKNIDGGG
jgi:hypothetical protein